MIRHAHLGGLLAAVATLMLHARPSAAAETPAGASEPSFVSPIVDLRVRSETVEQSGMSADAEAITLRGRFGLQTLPRRETSFLAEAEFVWPLRKDYNSTVNGKTEYPVVADPQVREINRLQLTNTGLPGTRIVIGRQRIALDDQRFVGNVGWRQNEQTFDALRVINASAPNLTVDVSWLTQVNRINGGESTAGRWHGDSYLANVTGKLPLGTLTAFASLLEFEEAATDSSGTFGVRYIGQRALDWMKLGLAASYAVQRDRANNPLDYEAAYSSLALTGTVGAWSLEAGVEQLTGDGVKGFSTPLATLHRFQGWADKFLATPPNGVTDHYLTAGLMKAGLFGLQKVTATASYHDFAAERGVTDYGSELDLQLRGEWKRLRAGLKFADYRADAFATNTTKYWIEAEYAW